MISAKDPFFGGAPFGAAAGADGEGRLGSVDVTLDVPEPFIGLAPEELDFADVVPFPTGLGADVDRSDGRPALPR